MDKEHSLGIETYRTILDLGFWKKLVYIGMDSRRALELCYMFYDRQNFEVLSKSLTLDDKSKILVSDWRQRLTLRDFWSVVNKNIRNASNAGDNMLSLI